MFDFGVLTAISSAAHSAQDANLTALSCSSSNSCPGVYDNAFGDLSELLLMLISE
jgi:hypothetical protein